MSRELTDFSKQVDEQFEIEFNPLTDIVSYLLSFFV
nr:phenylalanyl-tRNA synthetase subunit alpha [Mucilaginibacter sp. FT3.2]MBB6233115.1 hypothetical protein [Mucilaginibacter sp. FT3.2]